MIILNSKNVAFFRTFKTASTSIEAVMRPFVQAGDYASFDRIEGWPAIGKPKNAPPHATYEWASRRFEINPEIITFSIERNPWDRLVSEFFWRIENSLDPHIGIPELTKFNDWILSGSFFDNAGIYSDVGGNILLKRMFTYEKIEELWSFLIDSGIKIDNIPVFKKSKIRPKSYKKIYSKESIDFVAQKCWREIKNFGYEF